MSKRLPYLLFALQSVLLVLACGALVWSWFDRLNERQTEQALLIVQMQAQIAEQGEQIAEMSTAINQRLAGLGASVTQAEISAQAYRQKQEQNLGEFHREIVTLKMKEREQANHIADLRTRIGQRKIEVDHIVAREITVLDNEGRAALRMGTNKTHSFLQMNAGENRSNAVMLNVFNDGRKAFLFRNEAGRNRIGISTRPDGQPSINLMDNGEITLMTSKGFKVARLFEAKGKVGLVFCSAECKKRKALWSIVRSYLPPVGDSTEETSKKSDEKTEDN